MKTLRLLLIIALLTGITHSCKTLKIEKENNTSFQTHLTLYQNETETMITKPSATIEVERKEFSLRFFHKKYDSENNKFYAVQIAAFTDKHELDKIKLGMFKTDLPCFMPGSGMAPYSSGKYETLIFNNSGHHYIFYENSDSKRVNLIKNEGKLLQLEFEINAIYYNNKEVKINNTNLNEFYLAFYIDKNLNGIIDIDELNKMIVKLN